MGDFRFYLLNNTICYIVAGVVLTIAQPIGVFPAPCGIFENILPFTNVQSKYVLVVLFTSVVFCELSFFWSLLNRFAHAKPELFELVYKKYKRYTYTFMISVEVTISLCIAIPLCYFSPNTDEEMLREFMFQNPDISINGRIVFCVYKHPILRVLLSLLILLFVFLYTVAGIVFVELYKTIYGKHEQQKQTKGYKMQVRNYYYNKQL